MTDPKTERPRRGDPSRLPGPTTLLSSTMTPTSPAAKGRPVRARDARVRRGAPHRPQLFFDRVTIPVEGTDREYYAQLVAVQFAAALDLAVRAIHVDTPDSTRPVDLFRYLAAECARWGVPLEARTIRGTDVATELVAELGARDLVVIGTHRPGPQFHVGSVAQALVRHAPCPVQIVRIE